MVQVNDVDKLNNLKILVRLHDGMRWMRDPSRICMYKRNPLQQELSSVKVPPNLNAYR